MKKIFTNKKINSGFVALFTALLASVILSIAVGMSSVAFREVLLSSSATNGAFSFYSANTGAECALYYELKTIPPVPIFCASIDTGSITNSTESYSFNINNINNLESCAKVAVDKSNIENIQITSLGYNASCTANLNASGVVERAIKISL